MTPNISSLSELRPGMEHLNFRVKVMNLTEIRKVKTYSGLEHSIVEGEVADGSNNISFAVWNEKVELFNGISIGDRVELNNCFITSYKGVLQINVGRDSEARKLEE
jgi:ssDNA-binding replication factor A large subunit